MSNKCWRYCEACGVHEPFVQGQQNSAPTTQQPVECADAYMVVTQTNEKLAEKYLFLEYREAKVYQQELLENGWLEVRLERLYLQTPKREAGDDRIAKLIQAASSLGGYADSARDMSGMIPDGWFKGLLERVDKYFEVARKYYA